MSKTITWLHISDLHAGKPGLGWDAARVIEALVDDLKRMENNHGLRPDLIFFTGDAVFGQIGTGPNQTLVEQFAMAQRFFDSVRQAFSPQVPLANLFLVPGNHDVNRKVVGDDQTYWLGSRKDPWDIYKLMDGKDPQWQRYMERLADYRKFLEGNGYTHLLDDPDRLIYAAIRDVAGVKVGIGGFNSVWSCCRDSEEEKGKLWMGAKWQLEHVRAKLKDTDVTIVLMHHPVNWLNSYEDPDFGRALERDFRFTLHGHEHTEWVVAGFEGYTRIAAGACYERSDKDKESGYNFVRLDLETGEGEVGLSKYEPSGAGWVPCPIHGKTDDRGRWPLHHLPWLKSIPSLRPASPPREPASEERQPAPARLDLLPAKVGPIAPLGIRALRLVGLSDLIARGSLGLPTPFGATGPGLASVVMGPVRETIVPAQEDIGFRVVESKMDYNIALEEKTPLLQELRTEEEIARHFLPLPKFVDQVDSWLNAERDLVFVALPFCGKTTLLNYLALEAIRRRGDVLLPIRIIPREGLPLERVEAAVARLKEALRQSEYGQSRKHIVLILDNIHTPENSEIARLLMKPPRSWRLWAAARPSEFTDHPDPVRKELWDKVTCVYDACDLVDEKEMDFVVDRVVGPLLVARGEEKLIEDVREAMREAGQVPVRFLIQVWQLVHDNKGDVETGYKPLIEKEPRGFEEIVRHVMPKSRAGMDALIVADYFRGPSWELLANVLAAVGYGQEQAEKTVTRLRETLALLKDSKQPCRVTMYDPVRENIREEGNLTDSLKEQIWSGLEAFLEKGDSIKEEGEPDDVADVWLSLFDLAIEEERWQTGLGCAQRASTYATGERKARAFADMGATYGVMERYEEALGFYREALTLLTAPEQPAERAAALYQLAYCLHSKPEPKWDEAITCYREALTLLTAPEQAAERAEVLYQLAHCLRNKPKPEWDEAIALSREELALRTAPDQAAERAEVLYQLAYCLHSKPEPEWDKAITCYREALTLLTEPEQAAARAEVLYQLAYCLHSRPEPEWDGAIVHYREALTLLIAPDQAADRVAALYRLAYCLRNKPEWDEAITCYREALTLLTAPDQAAERAEILYQLAYCLHSKSEPEWDKAITCYREALTLLTEPEQAAARAEVLYQLAYCLHSKPELEWDKAITCYREALTLLTAPDQAAERAEVLYQLAYCLHSRPEPEWDGAIAHYREALTLLTAPDQAADRVAALYRLAHCLRNKPELEWDEAITCYREALTLLTAPDQAAERAEVSYQLAYCLHSRPEPEWDEAIMCYREALANLARTIELKPDYVEALASRGEIYQLMGQDEKALEDFTRAVDLKPDDEMIARRGDVHQALKQYEKAISDYQCAIRLAPENPFYHNNLGGVYLDLRRFEDARRELEKRVEMRPEDALGAHVYLGIIAYYQNNMDEAKQQFEQAMRVWDTAWERRLQSPAGLLENKAIALLCLGQCEAALQTLQEAKAQWRPGDEVELDCYNLLADASTPPEGLEAMVAILKQIADERDRTKTRQG